MIEGFLDDKRQNPSNKLDLAFFWSLVKEEGKDVCTMYQKLLIRLGIMEEEREEIYIEQVRQPLAGSMFLAFRFSSRALHCITSVYALKLCISQGSIMYIDTCKAEVILRL